MTRTIYFVTEGLTDQIVIQALIEHWLGDEDFIPRHIQPPSSDYGEGFDNHLSEGWKGVLDWCAGKRTVGAAGRDEALRQADCLIIHTDADVATDPQFKSPPYAGFCPPARSACDWVRNHLTASLGGNLPENVILCVPAQDLEAWVLCALHPGLADANTPIECHSAPCSLLAKQKAPRLVRIKDGRLRKETARYRRSVSKIVTGWTNCASGEAPRCLEAVRFEQEARRVLFGYATSANSSSKG